MTIQGWLLIAAFLATLIVITKPMGLWLFALYEGRRTPLHLVLGPVEQGFYRLAGIDPNVDQGWRRYAVHMLLFNSAGLAFTYAILRLQGVLPLNPQGYAGIEPHLAINTAVSFTTNTNWQSYSGEAAMSHFSQMVALTFHNFASAATGIALAFALFRGFARREAKGIGNFWADLTRITLYLLLPICLVYAVFLLANGVPQTLAGSATASTLEGAKQVIALGPVASQEAITAFARLLRRATVSTPNLDELEVLCGAAPVPIRSRSQHKPLPSRRGGTIADMAGQLIAATGGGAILATGIRLPLDRLGDMLVTAAARPVLWEGDRIDTIHDHGTGCTLASAIATGLGQGMALPDAILRARAFVRAALLAAPGLGGGHGPMGYHLPPGQG